MNLNERFDVSAGKLRALFETMSRLGVKASDIEEDFIRGGGRGGQKINKTANCVRLFYPPLDLSVRVQRERKRTVNRFLALRELVDQIEMKVSPETSEKLREIEKIRKRKSKRSGRSVKKYQNSRGTQV